jgi:hypothetical protein
MTHPLSPNISTSRPHPTDAEARLLREALSLAPTTPPPRQIQDCRTRWISAGTLRDNERTATLRHMAERGWIQPVVQCAVQPAAVTQLYAVTQRGLEALWLLDRS